MNKITRGIKVGVEVGLRGIFSWSIYLVPLFIVAGIFDYRFHNYFWSGLDALRPLGALAMFDFFSVATVFVWVLVGLYVLAAIFVPAVRPRVGFKWIYLVILFLAAGVVVAKVAYVPLEPVIKSFYFQVYINYISPVLMFLALYFGLGGSAPAARSTTAGKITGGSARSAAATATAASVAATAESTRVFERFQKSFLIVFGLFGLVILFKYFLGGLPGFDILPGGSVDFLDRLAWPYIDPFFEMKAESANWLSFLFGPTFVLAAVRLVRFVKTRKSWVLEGLFILIAGAILFLTKSYTGLGIIFLLCLYLGFVSVPKSWRKYVVIGLVVLMVGFVATQYNTRKFQILIGNDTQETSVNRRFQIYEFNYKAFLAYPLEGIGPGNYQVFFRENIDEILPDHGIPEIELPPHPHNLVTFWWSDLGIFGFLAILMVYAMAFFGIFRPERNEYFLVVGYFLGHGLLDLPYAMEENSLMFWAFLALALSAGNVTSNAAGNVTGNVTSNAAGNVTGNVTSNAAGNVTGNAAGNVTNNVTRPQLKRSRK